MANENEWSSCFNRVNWVDGQNGGTPVNAANLNKNDAATAEIDARVLRLNNRTRHVIRDEATKEFEIGLTEEDDILLKPFTDYMYGGYTEFEEYSKYFVRIPHEYNILDADDCTIGVGDETFEHQQYDLNVGHVDDNYFFAKLCGASTVMTVYIYPEYAEWLYLKFDGYECDFLYNFDSIEVSQFMAHFPTLLEGQPQQEIIKTTKNVVGFGEMEVEYDMGETLYDYRIDGYSPSEYNPTFRVNGITYNFIKQRIDHSYRSPSSFVYDIDNGRWTQLQLFRYFFYTDTSDGSDHVRAQLRLCICDELLTDIDDGWVDEQINTIEIELTTDGYETYVLSNDQQDLVLPRKIGLDVKIYSISDSLVSDVAQLFNEWMRKEEGGSYYALYPVCIGYDIHACDFELQEADMIRGNAKTLFSFLNDASAIVHEKVGGMRLIGVFTASDIKNDNYDYNYDTILLLESDNPEEVYWAWNLKITPYTYDRYFTYDADDFEFTSEDNDIA